MTDICTKIILALKENGLTIATAESCTGGLIGKSLTDISGASSVYWGGVISYDNSVKENVLGVKKETLDTLGAVSYDTACQMAIGVKSLLKTDIGISTTGIAGPGGGTPQKPVGTVYVAIADKDGVEGGLLSINPKLSRDEIRKEAAMRLLDMTYKKILEKY